MSSETENHEKQPLAILKRLKRCDDNELEKKLRRKKVVARLVVEMEEERRVRLEKMLLPNGSGWPRRWTKKEKQDWKR